MGGVSYVLPAEEKAEALFRKFEKGPESEDTTKSANPGQL